MRLVLGYIKRKYPQYYSTRTIKSVTYKVNKFSTEVEPLSIRVRKFLRVALLPLVLILTLKKTKGKITIIDNFISIDKHQFRLDFIKYFNSEYKNEDFVFLTGKKYFYNSLGLQKLVKCFVVWWDFSIMALMAIFTKKSNYNRIHFDNIASNLINLILVEPKKVYLFNLGSPTAYLTALFGQVDFDFYISSSNSVLYSANKYGHLPDATLLLCWNYQLEEYKSYTNLGWVKVKEAILWGPEEILEHSQVKPEPHQYDVGIYSRGDWARKKNLSRVKDLEALRNYEYSNDYYPKSFREMVKLLGEMKPQFTMKIYTHPLERDLYNKHNIKPDYWDLAEKYNIEIDLSEGNSIDKLYECKIGVGGVTTILMDRWGHELEGFMAYNKELDEKYCVPKHLGKYGKSFFNNIKELENLLIQSVNK
ncbi:MAG: hypothetical protein ACPG19_03260 [Saprospiraceae bacterium]